MTQKQIENQIKSIIFKYLSPQKYKIFVYGSRAAGRARKWSDYDIGVIGKKHLPPLAISTIENVDVVDFSAKNHSMDQIDYSQERHLPPN